MAERTLIEAFRSDVLEDADFLDAIEQASEIRWPGPVPAASLTSGLYPSASGLWPVAVDPRELRRGLFDPGPIEGAGRLSLQSPTVEMAEAALRQASGLAENVAAVFRRFLAPLQSGSMRASGFTAVSTILEIPPGVWQRPGTLIDPIAGEIGRLLNPRDLDGGELPALMVQWEAVSIAGTPEKPRLSPTRDRSKSKLPWDPAIDQILFKLCTGTRYVRRGEMIGDVLKAISRTHEDTDETQVMRFFRTYYPETWVLLKDG